MYEATQRPFRASCNELAGTPMEAPTEGLHEGQPQSLITDGAARRSITEFILPKRKGTEKRFRGIMERKKDA
jgi:hypothetical protein